MSHIENLSFTTGHGMEIISSADSERNRNRVHFHPHQSPLDHGNYREILKEATYSDDPRTIFIRNEDHYTVIDPIELGEIRQLPIQQRRRAFNAIAAQMYWAEEVIIEHAVPAIAPLALIEPKL